MAAFIKGEVVVVPFPYSDLSQNKRRPALIVAVLPGDDLVLCQITSQAVTDGDSVTLDATDFASGGLSSPSNIRPNKLFTADTHIVLYSTGQVKQDKLSAVVDKIVEVVRR